MSDTGITTSLPEALRTAFERDDGPVRPVDPATVGAAGLLVTALAVASVLAAAPGLRSDAADLGASVLWGLSLLELVAAVALAVAALRDATPGRRLPTFVLPGAATLGLVTHLGAAAVARLSGGVPIEEGSHLQVGVICGGAELLLAVLAGGAGLVVARWGSSPRPVVTGLALGLAAGLAGDAVWRTICPHTEPLHLVAHGLGLLAALYALGALTGRRLRGG